MSDQQRVQVDIFGRSYTVRGTTSPERVLRLAAVVDQKMNALFSQNPRLDHQTLAVLTALNLAEEHDALIEEYDALLEALELKEKEGSEG